MALPLETKKPPEKREEVSRELHNPTPEESAEEAPRSEVHPLRLEQRRQFAVLRKHLPRLRVVTAADLNAKKGRLKK